MSLTPQEANRKVNPSVSLTGAESVQDRIVRCIANRAASGRSAAHSPARGFGRLALHSSIILISTRKGGAKLDSIGFRTSPFASVPKQV